MRFLQIVGAVSLLFLLGIWLSLRSIDNAADRFEEALASLDRFATLEAALERDALAARAGVLRNYDTLARGSGQLSGVADRIGPIVSGYPELAASRARLVELVGQQSMLIEQFKSDNALLQNSLAYFQSFSGGLGASKDPATVEAVMALDSAMLQLTLDTSPESTKIVTERLKQLAALPDTTDGLANARENLVAHGRLLRTLLPQTDTVLNKLRALPIESERNGLRELVLAQLSGENHRARGLRVMLYGFSLILLASLAYMARALRARARALRERAAFDQCLAGVSMRFLNARPHEIDAEIDRSLAEFAALFEADRAYFLQFGKSTRQHLWQRTGASPPQAQGWLDQVPAMAGLLRAADSSLIHVPQHWRLEPGAARQALADAGVAGWLCLMVDDGEGERRILGFDAFGAGRLTDPAELGFARRALDVLVDAVARDALEREHARLAARLQQAQRMETIGAFASGIAHNFNNLVGAILGYCEMAEDAIAGDSRIARHIRQIHGVGERARELVGQILAFGRPYTAVREPVHIDRLIAETASLLRASLPAKVILALPERIEPAVVRGVSIQLQQVVLNLCTNAAQAMADEGRIEILVDRYELERPLSLDHGVLSPGPHVRIAVSDSGRGMGSDLIARIFEPFFTTRRAGNGLGLATVKEIVREHGGALAVASQLGAGSRFEVWLPQVAGAMVGGASIAGTERLRTVLLIDDDQARLERDEEILAAIGYEPVGFARPGDALAACLKMPGRYDAVILGQSVPTAELTAFAARLNAAAPDLPILLATIKVDGIEAPALTRAGIREVVGRPLNPADLALALRRCLDTAAAGL